MRIVLMCNVFANMLLQLYFSYILKSYADLKKRFEDPDQSYSHALYQERASAIKPADLQY